MKPPSFLLAFALATLLWSGVQNLSGQSFPGNNVSKPQPECTITLKDAPEMVGMRLGMSLEETIAAAPDLVLSAKKKRNSIGVSTSLSSKQSNDVAGVVNRYLNDILVEIDILFTPAVKWNNTMELIVEISRKFNLPQNAWKADLTNSNFTLICDGFLIEILDKNHLVLSDRAAKAEIKKRMEEYEELKKKELNP